MIYYFLDTLSHTVDPFFKQCGVESLLGPLRNLGLRNSNFISRSTSGWHSE